MISMNRCFVHGPPANSRPPRGVASIRIQWVFSFKFEQQFDFKRGGGGSNQIRKQIAEAVLPGHGLAALVGVVARGAGARQGRQRRLLSLLLLLLVQLVEGHQQLSGDRGRLLLLVVNVV